MEKFRSRRDGRPVPEGLGLSLPTLAFLAAMAWVGLIPPFVLAQGPPRNAPNLNPIDSNDALIQLRNAANHARDRQWAEAIEIYQRVIDRYGDKVVKVPRGEPGTDPANESVLFMDSRRYCHRCIAQLPPAAREIYRGRVDQLAGRWYKDGAARRDVGLLRRVIDQAFCSSWADDALELLGDLAFQDGRFGQALSYYGQLVADRADDPFLLVHPDPSVDLARVAAKKWLSRAASGNPPGPADLEEFAKRFPGATGSLAGRTGSYASIVARAIAADRLETTGQPDGRWPTFAGSPRRTRIVPGPIDVGQVQWRVDLDKVSATRGGMGRFPGGMQNPSSPNRGPEQLLAFHPIVLGDQVMICDGSRVLAYNLGDRPSGSEGGEARPVSPAWRHDPENGAPVAPTNRSSGAIPRYTLTAAGNRIFARMGQSSTLYLTGRAGRFRESEPGTSSIVALDWNTQGKLLWEKRSADLELPDRPGASTRTVNFEGTPVADDRNVYVAVTDRFQQTMIYVACFDAATGNKRWMRLLGAANPELDGFMGGGFAMQVNTGTAPGDYRHRLLTLDGSNLFYQTNLGALIAMDAETGATRWVATYPRQDGNRFGQTYERDLNPAVVHEGRVMVAPSDADSVFAFDAESGRLLWKTEPIADAIKLTHVLGVAKGRLVITGDRVLLLDVRNGKVVSSWPDSTNKSHEGFGRGLLAGDLIYWPTRTEIEVLDQRTGLRAEPPIKLHETYQTRGGNLSAGDGYLIIAQEDGLVVFCQNSRLIDRYREEIARAPERASNYYRMARAAEAIGREDTAMEKYREAIDKARPDESIDGNPLDAAARDHLFRLLMRQAGRSRQERRWDVAIHRLESAATYARTDAERLEARLLLSEIHLDASHPREAVDALERILLDARLRPLPVAMDEGRRTVRADLMVADRLGAIVRRHGRESYAAYDRQAAALLERGRKERDPHVLAEVGRDYPVASVVPDALLELGSLHESSGHLAEAAHAYKRLLAEAPDDRRRAMAIWAMARVYDARKLHVAARDAYLELSARYPKVRLESGGPTVAEAVARKLACEPYVRLVAERHQPSVAPPMFRRWHWAAADARGVRALSTEGVAPSLEASRIVLGYRDRLRLLDASDGVSRWSADLGSPAQWAGYLEDKLIAAGPGQVVALDLATGVVQWRYRPAGTGKDASRPDPFAAPGAASDEQPARGGGDLHEFRLVKGRVFCLRGANELVALDGDTGAVDWSFSRPPARSSPISGSAPIGSCSRLTGPISSWCCAPRTASPWRGPRWATARCSSVPPCRWTRTRCSSSWTAAP